MPDLSTYAWRSLGNSPMAARSEFGMTWADTEALLFAGSDAIGTQFNDTWSFVGETWTELLPANQPPVRDSLAMTWDGARALIYGGYTPLLIFRYDDTWAYTTDWVDQSPAAFPPKRAGSVMVWDGSSVLLFGGEGGVDGGPFVTYDDLWEYAAGNWADISPVARPDPRSAAVMVWTGSELLLFGGWDPNDTGAPMSDLWSYSAGTWTELSPATVPPARGGAAAVWDGEHLLMFGGFGNAAQTIRYDDTWFYDPMAGDWTQLLVSGPSSRFFHGMVWDGSRAILFGGHSSGSTRLTDTWIFESVSGVAINNLFGLGE